MRLTIHPDKHDSIRWWVLSMLFFATVIGYIDRLTISLLAPVIEKDLGINNLQYAGIASGFAGGANYVLVSLLSAAIVFFLPAKDEYNLGYSYLILILLSVLVMGLLKAGKESMET